MPARRTRRRGHGSYNANSVTQRGAVTTQTVDRPGSGGGGLAFLRLERAVQPIRGFLSPDLLVHFGPWTAPPTRGQAGTMTSPYKTPERTSEEMTFHDAEEKRQPVSLATVVGAMSGSDLEALDDNSDVSVSIADTESRESEGMTVAFKVHLLPPSRTPKCVLVGVR